MNASRKIVWALFLAACSATAEPPPQGGAGKDPKQAPRVSATRVQTAKIMPTSASIVLVRPGEVEPIQEARLAAALGGFIEKLDVKVGDRVKKGQILARVDTSLHAANKALAEVELNDAKRELGRLRSMGASIPRARVESAETRVERAEAQVRIARIHSDRTLIKAPFAGVIADVSIERGEVAPPGLEIVRVVAVEPVIVSVAVTDRDVGTLTVGGKARIAAGGLVEGIDGTIRRIEPTADLKTRSFTVEVEVTQPGGHLRPGMIATVDFQQTVAADAVVVPQDLLVTRPAENGVFVVEQGVARWRSLSLGPVVRDQVLVESGLGFGDVVVVLGHRGLSDGDELIVEREGECCIEGRIVFPTDQKLVAAETQAP